MTKDDVLSLTGRKLDAAVASRVLGWDVLTIGGEYYRQQLKENPQRLPLAKFCSDPAAFAGAEKAALERFGDPPLAYLSALAELLSVSLFSDSPDQGCAHAWVIMRASLEARCKAILLAVCEPSE